MDYNVYANYYGNLERLPDYQNIIVSYEDFFNLGFTFNYQDLRASLGGVDYEKGFKWRINSNNNIVIKTIYPQIHTNFDYGFALPINHSSIWLRSSGGYSHGDRNEPFANFYFGGFGNNYVDNLHEKRYREYYSFPGVELNEIGGTNYAKLMIEWNLPPLRFSNFGFSSFYLNFARTSLFSTMITTNIDSKDFRRSLANLGAQIDFKFIMFFHLKMTFSVGYAAAFEKDQKISLPPNDYALIIHYFSQMKVDDWQKRRNSLEKMIDDNAMIYQVLHEGNGPGMELYNKSEFIDKLTLPAGSLRNIEILDTKYKNDKIMVLRFRINE
jgi:hypothetical protein